MKGRLPSVMKHDFSRAPQANIQRSSFDRSHGYKTTFDAGYLVPIFLDEALPGDTFKLNSTLFGRISTLLFPIMDNVFLDTQFFAVPIRLLWNNWEKFNGAQDDPGDSTDFIVPTMPNPTTTGWVNGSLGDYFGLPTDVDGIEVMSLPFRAYNAIWNDWYRDENTQDSLIVDLDDGPDDPADYVLQKRGKRYDYFTSCLPWTQKGDAVDIPLGTSAPVVGDGTLSKFNTASDATERNFIINASGLTGNASYSGTSGDAVFWSTTDVGLEADLTNATAATINSLREAFQIQRLLERDARGGTRYTEVIRSHFGVISPDARLQRPEYLGGGSSRVDVQPVPQTSSTSGQPSPQANLAGYGTVTCHGHGFTKSFTEHCIIIGLCSVRADLNYQQGLNRMWSRSTRYDFYWPALSHLGEQAVLNKEIYADGTSADDDVFGYQERYAEYRYKPSLITGQFRSNFAQSLDAWHLAQDFASLPALNSDFIEENPPFDRIKALDSEYPDILLDCYFDLKCARPMPMYSVPGLIDHF